jgi:hypothetical protein
MHERCKAKSVEFERFDAYVHSDSRVGFSKFDKSPIDMIESYRMSCLPVLQGHSLVKIQDSHCVIFSYTGAHPEQSRNMRRWRSIRQIEDSQMKNSVSWGTKVYPRSRNIARSGTRNILMDRVALHSSVVYIG